MSSQPVHTTAKNFSAQQLTPSLETVGPEQTLTADEILGLLGKGGPLRVEKCTIEGGLNLSHFFIPDAITFHGCIFNEEFDATGARFDKTLTLIGCTFVKNLTLRGAHINGALNIAGSTVYVPQDAATRKVCQTNLAEPPPDPRSAKWDALTIGGPLLGQHLTVHGNLNLQGAVIQGSARLNGCQIGEWPDKMDVGTCPGRLHMRRIRVEGDLELSPWAGAFNNDEIPAIKPEAPVTACPPFQTHLRGSLSIGTCEIGGRFSIRGALIEGCVHATLARVKGRVLADSWVFPGDTSQTFRTFVGLVDPRETTPGDDNYVVWQSLGPGAETEHEAAETPLRSTQPTHNCPLLGMSIRFHEARIESSVWFRGLHTVGGVDFENASITGTLDFQAWSFGLLGPWNEAGTSPAGKAVWTEVQTNENGVEVIEGKGSASGLPAIYQTRLGMSLNGESIRFRNARIGANLKMDGVRTTGRIVGHYADIRGSISCVPFETPLLFRYIRPSIGRDASRKSLLLYGAKVGGKVDLSGARFEGDVRLQYMVVEGDLFAKPWSLGRRISGAFDGHPSPHSGQQGGLQAKPEAVQQDDLSTIVGASVKGKGFDMERIRLSGRVDCGSIKIAGHLCMEHAQIGGPVFFNNASIAQTTSLLGLSMKMARIGGDVDFADADIGIGLDATGMDIAGSLILKNTYVNAAREGREKLGGKAAGKAAHENDEPLFSLRLARIKTDWNTSGMCTDNHINVRALWVSKWSAHKMEARQGLDARGMSAATVVLKGSTFGREAPSGHKVLLNLSQCNVRGHLEINRCTFLLASEHRPPQGRNKHQASLFKGEPESAAIDLGHAQINRLEVVEDCPGALVCLSTHGLNLVGFDFHHLQVGPSIALPPSKGLAAWRVEIARRLGCLSSKVWWTGLTRGHYRLFQGRPRPGGLPLIGLLVFLVYLWILDCLAYGTHPTTLSFLYEQIKQWAAAISARPCPGENTPPQEAQWCTECDHWYCLMFFYGLAALAGLAFLLRSFAIIRPGWEISVLHRATPKGRELATFLARSVQFSQEPYNKVRQMLEQQGEDDEARDVYYFMRGRELREGEMSAITRLFKWGFFVAAGSGVRVFTLCGFLMLYFCFTWLAVFSNPSSVEHPSTFVTEHAPPAENKHGENNEVVDHWKTRTGAAEGPAWEELDKFQQGEWTWRDGFWMAVKVHVPLIHLWAKEKWEPAAVEGWYFSPTAPPGHRGSFKSHMRKMWWGMEYETYAVIAQIISYLTIPMLITAIGGFYKSDPASHGHHHTHSHGGEHGHHA